MGKFVGIWINNRKALIVSLEKGLEQHQTLESHAVRHVRLPGEPKGMSHPEKADGKYQDALRTYFNEILENIKGAKEIFICGPGMAKENLKKLLLESGESEARIVAMETADKMTDNQVIAKAKEVFAQEKAAHHHG